MTKPTILVVEDDADLAREIIERAQAFGYEVIHTTSRGDQAVAKARELRPDLILMDIGLEGQMDGIQAAGLIRELQLPVVYVTGSSDAYRNGFVQTQNAIGARPPSRGTPAGPRRGQNPQRPAAHLRVLQEDQRWRRLLEPGRSLHHETFRRLVYPRHVSRMFRARKKGN